ncbi:MAG TPA: type I methionyl aminopeptidase [bacterium]|nr:type I methionyl aminopeptidase [bacterium]HQL61968.1 type I methionyl aminopeptidase [bacterium]
MTTLKSAEELQRLRESNRLVAEVMQNLLEMVEPSISTLDLDAEADRLIRERGAIPAFKGYRDYPNTICASVNEQVVHGIPSSRKLREGDLVSIDVGVRYRDFYGDMCRTVPVGKISAAAERQIQTARICLSEACNKAVVGNRLGDICMTIEAIAHRNGYEVVRDYVGHGIGRRLHEDPQIPNFGIPRPNIRLRPGLVLAIEPMLNAGNWEVERLSDEWTVITKDRKLSVHFEDVVAVTEDGPEILTRVD